MFPIGTYRKIEVSAKGRIESDDLVAEEEPLEVLLESGPAGQRKDYSMGITMRTPGNDFALAIGLLYTGGVIPGMEVVSEVAYCNKAFDETGQNNVVRVKTTEAFVYDARFARTFFRSGSCGVCGSDGIAHLKEACSVPLHQVPFPFSSRDVLSMREKLSEHQLYFKHTGGLHAAAFFSADFKVQAVFEDIGRHNALDKLIGSAMVQRTRAESASFLWLSSRAGFELIQKAARFGTPVVACAGAPSGLAIRTARETGITLIGFLREDRFNIYTFPHRLIECNDHPDFQGTHPV